MAPYDPNPFIPMGSIQLGINYKHVLGKEMIPGKSEMIRQVLNDKLGSLFQSCMHQKQIGLRKITAIYGGFQKWWYPKMDGL